MNTIFICTFLIEYGQQSPFQKTLKQTNKNKQTNKQIKKAHAVPFEYHEFYLVTYQARSEYRDLRGRQKQQQQQQIKNLIFTNASLDSEWAFSR